MAAPARTALFNRSQPGGMFAIEDSSLTTGKRFFVNSVTGANAGNGGFSPDRPLASIAYALTLCTASQNDIIYCMPGHAETIAAAGALACSVAGVSIIGMGNGTNRPTITLAGTDSTIPVSAANVTMKNLVIKVSIDEVVSCFNVTAANLTLNAVDFVETTSCQLIQFLKTSALGTDLVIKNCNHYQATAAAANSLWIQLIGADRTQIVDSVFQVTTTSSASSNVIESDTTAPVNILLKNLVVMQPGGTATIPVKLVASTTGMIINVYVASAKTAIAGSIAAASCYCFNCYATHVVNKSGLLEPVVDA